MTFNDIVACMEPLFEQLESSQLYRAGTNYRGIPEKGIYVFYEDREPIYVGRVGGTSKQNMRGRIRQHARPSSGHNTATFAFRLLQDKLGVTTGHGAESNRAELANNHPAEFKEMKERVRNMVVRAVEIENPVIQTLFEVYASLALKTTRYNSFETH
ncbi:MAG: GIY-YIG nuclease family protein [Chloroflexota bacterium]|nr:GIY-YIG nuclease family protein [Chloroflexota bacterium]MDE2942381.1 GIY-YIG nuclease family protein [Chloroflexota bacterium]MDE3267939.1 GIY-YIG nuclease family protein [Chloroflexota bacterium]